MKLTNKTKLQLLNIIVEWLCDHNQAAADILMYTEKNYKDQADDMAELIWDKVKKEATK